MSLNATLHHIFMEHQTGVIFMAVVGKDLLQNISLQSCQWLALWGVLDRHLPWSCYENVICVIL